jgi:hypothetical protein
MTLPATTIACIANNGANGEREVPLWDCPCAVCTRMEWELTMNDVSVKPVRLGVWRREAFPEVWDTEPRCALCDSVTEGAYALCDTCTSDR